MRKVGGIVLLLASLSLAWTAQAQDVVWAPTAIDTSLHVRSLFAASDGAVYAATNAALVRIPDEGARWEAVGPGDVNAMAEGAGGVLFAAGRQGVHRSTDQGQTWQEVLPPPLRDECPMTIPIEFTLIEVLPGGAVLAGVIREHVGSSGCKYDGSLYRSDDGGDSWPSRTTILESRALLVNSQGVFFLGDTGGWISRSTDQGKTWPYFTELGNSITSLKESSLGVLFASDGSYFNNYLSVGTGIYRSGDAGETWQQINTGLTDTTVNALAISSEDILLAATQRGGIHRSSDGGDSWQEINAGLPSLTVTALAVTDDGFVYAGTDRGIYRSTEAIATASEDAPERPARFVLHGNYPNPFNPQTRIRFDLPEASAVQLVVYDAIGREVAHLLDTPLPAGRHEAVFEGAGLPSGLYVYRLTAGGQVRSAKMLLVK